MRRQRNNFFMPRTTADFVIENLSGELNNSESDIDISDSQLSDGQNVIPISDTSIGKRDGIGLYNNFLGNDHGIDGGWSFVGQNGTQEEIVVWNGSLYRNVTGTWTAVTGVTFTADLPCSGVYFADTNKFYIVNGTDNVVKYQAGSTSGDQTDATLPKGKYITSYQGRLIVGNIGSNINEFQYSDAGVDTGWNSGTKFVILPGEFNIAITGLLNYNNIALLIFTKRRIYRLQNFAFDGTNSWVSQLYELPSDFGSIYDRTIAIVQGKVYFLGQDMSQVAAIYVTDGYTCANISYQKIRGTTNTLNASALATSCAVADSVFYRLYVPDGSNTNNTVGIVYDTSKNIFLSPQKRFINGLVEFSTLWTSEISNKWTVFAGTQSNGQVYKLHSNAGLFDEMYEQNYLLSGSGTQNVAIDANPAKRAAMSFKNPNYNTTQTVTITKAILNLKKNAGTTTGLTVRIETDNAGAPSGTLVNANATGTIAAFNSTSYAWYTVTFTNPFNISGNTKYWLVVQHTTEGAGNSQYFWRMDTAATYTNGAGATYVSAAWTAQPTFEANFGVYFESAIDGYLTTKAFIPNKGRQFSIKRFQTMFSNPSASQTNMILGFANDSFANFTNYMVIIASATSITFGTTAQGGSNATFGTTGSGGTGAIYGLQNRQFQFTSVDNFSGRTLKLRVRNNQANQQFEFNQMNVVLATRSRNS